MLNSEKDAENRKKDNAAGALKWDVPAALLKKYNI